MGSVNLIRSSLDSLRQVSDDIADTVLYMDAGASEAFESLGGFPLLLELGVQAVCSLENATPIDTAVGWKFNGLHTVKKIAVITSCFLSDAHRYILRCLAMHRNITCCTIFTSISEVAHSTCIDSPLGPDAFREYESLLLQDFEELVKKNNKMQHIPHQFEDTKGYHQEDLSTIEDARSQLSSAEGHVFNSLDTHSEADKNGFSSTISPEADGCHRLVVSVHHLPMIFCALSPRVFVFPSEGTIGEACLSSDHEDSLSPGLPAICSGLPADSDDIPSGATLTAHFLYHLISKMDLKMEVFSLGDLSKNIGKILTDMSSLYDVGRTKKSIGLLLIDRSLDLLTPCCHGDSLVDRMLSCLPRRKRMSSSSHVKGSQLISKHAPAQVIRPSLDARVPLDMIFSKEESEVVNGQLAEAIAAFESGWNCGSRGSETASVSDQREIFNGSDLKMDDNIALSGSLILNEGYLGANYIEALLDRRTKDGALLIKKWLIETIRRDKIPLTMKGRLSAVSASDLHSLTALLASTETSLIKNKGIIQLAIAAEIALSEPHRSHWDAFVSAERILNMSTGDATSQSLSSQIRDLINASIIVRSGDQSKSHGSSHSVLSLKDALVLAITGYILAGESFPTSGASSPFSWEEEHSLKETIVDAILETPGASNFNFLHGLEVESKDSSTNKGHGKQDEVSAEPHPVDDFDDQWGSWDDEVTDNNDEKVYGDMQLKLELRDKVDNLFKFFHKLAGMKWKNPTSREGHGFEGDGDSRRCLLSKVLSMILDKNVVPGLEYHSSVVGRFFKSGFGRFGLGQSNPSFGDQSVLMVFMVGGINGLEVFEAQKVISESGRPDIELIIGGSTLLTPDDMFELLLGSSGYI